ncbi:MAG: hypothetical protein CO189_01015 [candidate division Zixibacteria bacterium CG_4_9_14_3_um_filter_46_8]|nr:MAG: hypothetical protein CO189_01015 [candidate division Zixibacteria bacterium CG_4_9_14_3_um_filter_46_8]
MNCRKCQEYAIYIIERGVPVDIFPEVMEHLRTCSSCESEFQATKNLFGMLATDRLREIHDSCLDGIVVDINHRLDAQSKSIGFNPRYVFSLATALAASILIVIWGSYSTSVKSPENYYANYYDQLSVQELLETVGAEGGLKGAWYLQYDNLSINEFERYFMENSDYKTIMTALDQNEIEYIRTRIDKEMKGVS